MPEAAKQLSGIHSRMKKIFYVYILASRKNGTLYTGITSNLVKHLWEHKNDLAEGFTKKYKVHVLVHYEEFTDPVAAILREKQLKKWRRNWKIQLIEKANSEWADLYPGICS